MRTLTFTFALLIDLQTTTDARAPLQFDESFRNTLSALPTIGSQPLGDTQRKIVIVTFFASWCPPCRWEFKSLNAVCERYDEKDVAIVAVNWFEDWGNYKSGKRMQRFLASTKPQFPLVEGTKTLTDKFGGVDRIPTLFVFDRNGREAFSFVHLQGAEKMHVETDELIGVLDALQ